ncbi:MAG: MFS transporter [Bryobacterales bacterium]|nr:MFS transporter [Bryobacterales bacterium]
MIPVRWSIAALLFLSTVINYVDRQTLSVVAPVLTKELNLSPVEYANILTAFLVTYTIMYLGSGFLVDRWGTRAALAIFMVWWSVSNMLHSVARSAFQLGALRMLLGMGESGNFMAAFKAISEWYPAKERAFVNGLVQAGASVGAILAPPAVTLLMHYYGWRWAFLATGSLGFIWLFFWLRVYYVPAKHPRVSAAERELVLAGTVGGGKSTLAWRDLLKFRQTWGLLLARFFSDPVWWFFLFWLPKYLVENRGFTVYEMGMLAWMPYLTADLGAILGGLASDRLVRRKWAVLSARTAAMLPFALLMPLSAMVAFVESRWVALALICCVTFAHMAWKTNLVTVTNDLYPANVVGSLAGIVAFGNGLGGTLFNVLTGIVVQHFSYTAIFVIMGCLHPAAFLIFRALVRKPVTTAGE